MLQPLMSVLQTQRIVLASGSVYRKQILQQIGLPFEIKISEFEEDLNKEDFDEPYKYAVENAKQKALAVAKSLFSDSRPADLIIGADTVVSLNNRIYEKPKDYQDACRMLSDFSGKKHTVYTGVVLVRKKDTEISTNEEENYETTSFFEGTDVTMGRLSPEVVKAYVDTGEPMGKAGGYGIQGIGASLVESINGDFYNVEGFPVFQFCLQMCNIYKKCHK